jgi:signal transduction histidine kinase/CheY-like chemotaxis protein/HPt (histidine-containing phosphotransfer) domain-containing protein
MSEQTLQRNSQASRHKVIAGFVLAGLTLVLFWLLIRYLFAITLANVEEFSKPNDKLSQVHQLFQEFMQADQLQRHIAVQDKKGRRRRITEISNQLAARIDTLKNRYPAGSDQYHRLDSVQKVMKRREALFWDFIQQRDELFSTRSLERQAHTIAELIAHSQPAIDSSVTTSVYRQTTTTMTPPDTVIKTVILKRQGGWLSRLFGKKQALEIEEELVAAQADNEVVVEEVLDSVINTLVIVQEDTLLPLLEEKVWDMIQRQQEQGARVVRAEMEFLQAGSALTNKILAILHEIEEEEVRNIEANQLFLTQTVDRSFDTFNWLLIGILLILSVLVFLILIDFSKSRRFRMQLIEAKEEAEKLSRVKDRFLSNMSHEIRTPLQSIIGYAGQILEKEHPPRFEKEAIHRSALHLLQIVNEILDYNRLVSDRFQLDARPFNLKETLEEICSAMRAPAEAKGLAFVAKLDVASNGLLLGDAFRLRQVMYNLLGNAVKFTEEGRIVVAANARYDEAYCRLQLLVEDTGIGISDEGLKHIFNQFEQAPGLDRQKYGGAGLGLSIVKALIDIQGGSIEASSAPGEGAKFHVDLKYPIATATAADIGQNEGLAALPSTLSGGVCLIDDDAYNLKFCEQILGEKGMHVLSFSCPIAFLASKQARTIDLVITDLRLPNMSGVELMRKLRAERSGDQQRATIIAMTAQALPQEQKSMRAAGFDEVLIKPFTAERLISMVGAYVANRQALTLVEGEDHKCLTLWNAPADEALQDIFVQESINDLEAIREALNLDDAALVVECLHRLAGRTGQFGYMDWYQVARELEYCLRADPDLAPHRKAIEQLGAAMTQAFETVLEEMRSVSGNAILPHFVV